MGPKFAFCSKIGSKFIVIFCSKIGPKISNILSMADEVTINLAIEMILINQFEYDEIGDDDGLREL